MKCVVLGAGIAGLVSALELLRAGCAVTLVEAGPFAGGRASSWKTPAGLASGTGLHVVGNHYTNLLDILRSTGAVKKMVWWDDHFYLRPGRKPVVWRYNRLPAPFHLLRAAVNMPAPLGTRWRLARAGLEIRRTSHEGLAALDSMTYLEWHRARKLGDGFVRDLAEIAADAAMFLPLERVSARAVLSWLKYMTASRAAGRIGTWRAPLGEGLIQPLVDAIHALGGEIRFQMAAVRVAVNESRVEHVAVRPTGCTRPCFEAEGRIETNGPEERLGCDAVISALPVQYLRGLVDLPAVALRTVPAISLTIGFDRRIQPAPEGAPLVSGCSIRDFIRVDDGGSVFLFLMSRAEEWLTRSDEEIVETVTRDFRALWPGAVEARPVRWVVERIGAAMFAATPGTHALRPGTRTGIANLFLAGDWVRHDLNASMEGAALSGRLAAQAVLAGAA
jgi:uncharacterized protein with NAD-binding domain and iron-sulfur cluster